MKTCCNILFQGFIVIFFVVFTVFNIIIYTAREDQIEKALKECPEGLTFSLKCTCYEKCCINWICLPPINPDFKLKLPQIELTPEKKIRWVSQ
jgi:hypothetical protein